MSATLIVIQTYLSILQEPTGITLEPLHTQVIHVCFGSGTSDPVPETWNFPQLWLWVV